MRGRGINWLGVFSTLSLLGGVALFVVELVLYSRTFATLPAGISMGGVPVGGLTEQDAAEQVLTAYRVPVELHYHDSVILLDPAVVNFQVNTDLMLPQVNQFRTSESFWDGFWKYLWLQPAQLHDVPLEAAYSPEKLRTFLEDVAARYDHPGQAPTADPATLSFTPGEPGQTLNIETSMGLLAAALFSPVERAVDLPISRQTSINPSLETLAELIGATADLFQFDGIFSLYLADLQTGREVVVKRAGGLPAAGSIAFSAMSTIKIPIMVSFFAQNEGELTDDEQLLLQRSIDESANTATDLLLKTIGRGDGLEGTRRVVADMQRLGLSSTFISGLLDVVGAVLAPLSTPANARTDLTTLPDPYNQTTAEEMGALLVMIYQCTLERGALLAAFPGQFTPPECQTMIDLLSQNLVGPIFISGGTPGGVVAHKHGWDRLPLTNVADAAIVFTPSTNYVLTVYVHQPNTMGFDDANRMIIAVARAIYNFYHPAASSP